MSKRLPNLLDEFAQTHQLNDADFLAIHESIPWHDAHYEETPEGFIALLKDYLKNDGNSGEFTVGRRFGSLMRQFELSDKDILDAHDEVYWEYSSEEGIDGMFKEIRNQIKNNSSLDY